MNSRDNFHEHEQCGCETNAHPSSLTTLETTIFKTVPLNLVQQMQQNSLYSMAVLRDSKMSGRQLTGSNCSAKPERKDVKNCRKRASLTPETAAAIFKLCGFRQNLGPKSQEAPMHTHTGRSVLVSRMFGISPKTVRDIWNLRTWRHVTSTLQVVAGEGAQGTLCETAIQLLPADSSVARPVGRPRGSKDSRPRRRRDVVTTTGPVATANEQAHFAAAPQPPFPPQSPAALLSLYCVSSTSPSKGQCPAGECIWCAEPAETCGCPAGGPPAAAGCPFWSPAGASAAEEEDDDLELHRNYPFFLQDALL